jgi:hypothetical protein
LGQVNQRSATCGSASGVHKLIAAMKSSSTQASVRATRRMRSWSRPSVFMISHVAPSIA